MNEQGTIPSPPTSAPADLQHLPQGARGAKTGNSPPLGSGGYGQRPTANRQLPTTTRPITVTMRPDLSVVNHHFRGQPQHVVTDPISLQQHLLNEQEFAILQWLDGHHSAVDIQRLFHDQFAPHRLELREIESCWIRFHEKNLLESSSNTIGRSLYQRSKKKRYTQLASRFTNPLAIRLPGWDPRGLLDRLTPMTGWFFSAPWVVLSAIFFLASAIWFSIHASDFYQRLPALESFFSPANWLGMACVVLVVKLLHELGHGIAATRYGVRCHELGISLMMFMPTLYINTSNAWRLQSKWQRIAIAAAGMYVELWLASIATWVWWYSEPGMIQYTALNVMAMCSMGALLFNANPLMKYDGYFILSDFLEIPNLQQRSNRFARDCFLVHCTGMRDESESESSDRTRAILLGYAVSSFAFRLALLSGIAWLLRQTGRSIGLEPVAHWFVTFSLVMVVAGPFVGLVRYFWAPGRLCRMEAFRVRVTGAAALILIAGYFVVPLPSPMVCDCTLEPAFRQVMYAEQDAVLSSVRVRPGEWVAAGETVAVLRNIDLEMQFERTRGEVAELEAQEWHLSRMDQRRSSENRERAELRARLNAKREAQRELENQLERLTLRSEHAGYVQSSWIAPRPERPEERLSGKEGWTLPVGVSRPYFQRGEEVCRVVDGSSLVARVVIPQREVSRLRVGQSVRILADAEPGRILLGEVISIAEQNIQDIDPTATLQHGGSVEGSVREQVSSQPTRIDAESHTQQSTYEALVSIREVDHVGWHGHHGIAKIATPWETAFQQTHRFLARHFQ